MIIEFHHDIKKTFSQGWWSNFITTTLPVSLDCSFLITLSVFSNIYIRTISYWDDCRMSPCLTEDAHRDDGRFSPCLTEDWLTHWDNGRISPCLTEDFLTGMMVECHHVLQKTFSLGRWTNFTMSYRRLTYSLGWWTNFTMSYRRLTHWDDGRMSACLTQDLLTGMIVKFHHVLQKTCSLGWWTNFTMSYRRLTHWGDERISPCRTED